MKKATSQEFNDLLVEFKLKNSIVGDDFDCYATLRFCKETLLNDFYNISIVKTTEPHYPIALQYNNNKIYSKVNDIVFSVLDDLETLDFVPVITKSQHDNMQLAQQALNDSHSFKEFVDNMSAIFGDVINSNDFNTLTKKSSVFNSFKSIHKLAERLTLESTVESDIRYHLNNIEEALKSDAHSGVRQNFQGFFYLHEFRRAMFEEKMGYMIGNSSLVDIYYNKLDENFEVFKFQKGLSMAVMLNAKTEEQLLNTVELDSFIAEVKQNYPDWFLTFEESLTHGVMDDDAIRLSGQSIASLTADFDVIDPMTFMATAYPSYTDGYTHVSKRLLGNTFTNFVHLFGDNSFIKVYYHHLSIMQKDNLTVCNGIVSDVMFSLPDEKKKEYVLPVLDYLEKNKIVLDIDRSSTLLHVMKKPDLFSLIEKNYPNLVYVDFENSFKKANAILRAGSFDEAFKLYLQKDDEVKVEVEIEASIKDKQKNKPYF